MKKLAKIDFNDELLGSIEVSLVVPREPSVRQLNARVHAELDADDPLDEIIKKALDKREWIEDSAVVLIHVQSCSTCGTISEFSHGWFTGKHHASDRFLRQLVAGKPVGHFPLRVERYLCKPVDVCPACAESQILIEAASRGN